MARDRFTETGAEAADAPRHPAPLVLARYLDGGLARGHAAAVLAHAVICGECGRRLARLAAARGYRFIERLDATGRRSLTIVPRRE